jgi:hypothetical protein
MTCHSVAATPQLGLSLRDVDIPFAQWLRTHRAPELIQDDAEHAGTFECFWRSCRVGQRLLWVADKVNADKRMRVRAALECARLVFFLIPPDELPPRRAMEVAERFTRHDATVSEVSDAWDALWHRLLYYDADWYADIRSRYENDPLPALINTPEATAAAWRMPTVCPWWDAGHVIAEAVSAAIHGYTSHVLPSVRDVIGGDCCGKNSYVAMPSAEFMAAHRLEATPETVRKVGQVCTPLERNPVYAKHDTWGNPPTIAEEAAAKAEYDCANIVREHVPLAEMVSRMARLRVAP